MSAGVRHMVKKIGLDYYKKLNTLKVNRNIRYNANLLNYMMTLMIFSIPEGI